MSFLLVGWVWTRGSELSPFCLMQSTANHDRICIKAGTADNLHLEDAPNDPSLTLSQLAQS